MGGCRGDGGWGVGAGADGPGGSSRRKTTGGAVRQLGMVRERVR